MAENKDNDKKITESKNYIQTIRDGLLVNIEKIKEIKRLLPKDTAIKKIEEDRDADAKKGNTLYFPVYAHTLNWINEKFDDKEYDKLINDFVDNEIENIDKMLDSIIELGGKNLTEKEVIDEVKAKYPNIPQDKVKQAVEQISNSASIDETLEEDKKLAEAEISEDEIEDQDLISRPETDDIKKIYKYNVEGKITSGISELDQFLEIIQPALNQLIIVPWKFIYGAIDVKNVAFEKFGNWQSQQKDVDSINKALVEMGAINKGEFTPGFNLKKNQNQVANYFNRYMCKKLNTELAEDKIKNFDEECEELKNETNPKTGKKYTQDEAEEFLNKKYEPRKKFFDFSKETDTPKRVLTKELAELVRKCREKGGGKINDDSKKVLNGFAAAIDLFNTKNKDIIKNNYANAVNSILAHLEDSTFGEGNVEDNIQKIFDRIDEDSEEKKIIEAIKKMSSEGK